MVSLGVTGKILSLALAAVLVTAVCSTVFIVQTRANIEDQVFVDQAELGLAYARAVHEYLSGSQSVVETVARIPAVRAPLHPELIQPALHGIPEHADAERRASLSAMIDRSGRMAGTIMASASGDVYLTWPNESARSGPKYTSSSPQAGAQASTQPKRAQKAWPPSWPNPTTSANSNKS